MLLDYPMLTSEAHTKGGASSTKPRLSRYRPCRRLRVLCGSLFPLDSDSLRPGRRLPERRVPVLLSEKEKGEAHRMTSGVFRQLVSLPLQSDKRLFPSLLRKHFNWKEVSLLRKHSCQGSAKAH